jgi:5'-methylthioadenosine phosphorylase
MALEATIGLIGGSGLYDLPGFRGRKEVKLKTPFGAPSDAYVVGELREQKVAFLPRHGRLHGLLPHELPHRANIYGFKKLGVRWIVGISAVGSLQQQCKPGDVVLPDQYFDRTKGRQPDTFFGDGIAAHISFGDPVSPELLEVLYQSAQASGATVHRGGVYVNMEGPAFSTRAESEFYRQSGYTVIGMTNLIEAKLAREAEIAYATMAMVTDYDCWHPGHAHVTVEMVMTWLKQNTTMAQQIITHAIPPIAQLKEAKAHCALRHAILTPHDHWPKKTMKKLGLLLDKYIN